MAETIRHVVVLGHPAEHSFNHTIAETYCQTVRECGQEAVLRDLYAIGFDPLLKDAERPGKPGFTPAPDVAAELDLLRDASVVTLVYPIWFGMPPAIIKGYVDRVLGSGVAPHDIQTGATQSLLHGKHLRLLTSSASTRPWLEEQGQWVSLRQAFDTYLSTIFSVRSHDHVHFDAIVEGTRDRLVEECRMVVHEKTREWSALVLSEHRRPASRLS
ncbi:NAD(P)H-dependent oxidoreductase [Sphingomonas sp. dw_22]|uniref:NAD(P)H-dependent oxidoreductase n=1 Tax=Sphingomonas sp. dw_22 TaxID=2721175 RepID=UPI001BD6B6A9|nr:NAD(P)H-dependent oxidoreductase [Sphingomonas sp. dw_22]